MSREHIRYEIREHHRRVDRECRRRWGVGIMAWRTFEALYSLGVLVLAALAIREGTDPTVALAIAAFLINSTKAYEWWLVYAGKLDYEDVVDTGDGE